MAARRKPRRAKTARKPATKSASAEPARSDRLTIRQIRGTDEYEFVHPRCAEERREDLEEVRLMIDAGEVEIARDELRWLLDGCGDLVEAHQLLGDLAWMDGDVPLARGHFGYAYRIGVAALPTGRLPGPLPYERPANRAFFESSKALVACLQQLERHRTAREVIEKVVKLDPTDPLGFQAMLAEADDDGSPAN